MKLAHKARTLQAAAGELGPGDVNAHMRFLVSKAEIAEMRDEGLLDCGSLDNFGSEYAWGDRSVRIELTDRGRKWLEDNTRVVEVKHRSRVLTESGEHCGDIETRTSD